MGQASKPTVKRSPRYHNAALPTYNAFIRYPFKPVLRAERSVEIRGMRVGPRAASRGAHALQKNVQLCFKEAYRGKSRGPLAGPLFAVFSVISTL